MQEQAMDTTLRLLECETFKADRPALHKTWGQRPNPLPQRAGPESPGAEKIPAQKRLFKEEGEYVTQEGTFPTPSI